MAVQVDYRIAPSDQFSVYNPDTKSNKTITYFTLLAKIRGDLNLNGGGSGGGDITGGGSANYVAKFSSDKNIVNSQIYDTGTYIGIGNLTPAHKLDVDGGVYADYFQLDTTYSDGAVAGKFSWNPDRETAELGLDGTVSLILGQDNLWYVKNQTGTAIPKGVAVMAVGALGASSRILVAPMVADGTISSKYLIGITIEEIANGDDGFVLAQGKLRGIDTSGFTQGTVLYCDPNNAGLLTSTEPTAPNLKLPIAFTVDSKNNGTLAVRITAGTTISEANDVQITSAADKDMLIYNGTGGYYENIPAVAPADLTIMTDFITYVEANGGTVEAVGPVGQLLAELTGATVPTSTSNTGGTVLQNIAVDQYGRVFGVSSISLDTDDIPEGSTNLYFTTARARASISAGTGISYDSGTGVITNSDKGSSQNIFKNIAVSGQSTVVADSNDDTLTIVAGTNVTITTDSATDSITINAASSGGTVTNIATSAPITGGPITSTGTIGITQSGTSTDGYLSSTDWNTFNSKEPALTKGDLTESTSSILTIGNGTGAVIGSGTTITVAQSGSSTDGYLSSTDWNTFNGKEPALTKGNLTETTSAVLTITGGTNAVIGSGTTIQVSQASTSTSGYLSSIDWNTFNDKEPALTKGNLTESTSAILTITGGTNSVIGSGTTIEVSQASSTTSGYLSSTDWNTFNDKEPALNKGNLTETTSAILTITGGTNAVIGSGTTIAVSQASTSTSGYLSSIDWNTFNDKEPAITKGNLTETTSAILTITGGTNAVIGSGATIAVSQASTSTSGYLSSTDWNTFNGKQDTLTFGNLTETTSSILTITGGTGAVVGSGTTIAVTQASASTNGFLSSTDWTTFNNKEPAVTKGNLTETTSSILTIVGGTGAVIGSGTTIAVTQAGTSTSGYLSSTDWGTFDGKADYSFVTIAVSGQSDVVADSASDTLTFVAGSGVTITTDAAGDSVTISATGTGGTVTSVDLTAGAKIAVSGGPITTSGSITVEHTAAEPADLPTMTSFITYVQANGGTVEAVGPVGQVLATLTGATVATSTANTGGTVLQNIAVDDYGHVFGVSSITLDTDDIAEGSTNLYYTDARARAALSAGSGISYDSGTGVITNSSNIFETIAVSGQTSIVADSLTDTLTIVAGDRIDITTDAGTDTLTITHGLGDGVDLATAQAFQARVIADGGTFEAVWPVAVAIGALSGGTPANTESNNTDGEVLQNIAIDEFGHVLGYSSYDLDDRYVQSLIGGDGISVSGTPSTTAGAITVTNTDAGSDQSIFKNIAVSGQSTIVADNNDDTLTVAAGTGITLATTAASDTLTITNSAPDQTVALTAGTGISISGTYPNFTITGTAQSNYTNLISAQVGEADGENTTTLNYGVLYSLSALGGVGARTRSTPVMDMYHFTNVQYTGASGLQSAVISGGFYSAAINGTAVPTSTDLVTAEFLYHSQMAAMMMQNHHGQNAKLDLSQVDAMLTIVGSLTLAAGVQTRLIVVHFGKDVYPYDQSGNSTFTNRRPDVWQYGYSSVVSGTLTEKFFGLTMANDNEADLNISIAMSGWGFVLVNVEDSGDYTSTATIENNSLIRIRCREEYYTI